MKRIIELNINREKELTLDEKKKLAITAAHVQTMVNIMADQRTPLKVYEYFYTICGYALCLIDTGTLRPKEADTIMNQIEDIADELAKELKNKQKNRKGTQENEKSIYM